MKLGEAPINCLYTHGKPRNKVIAWASVKGREPLCVGDGAEGWGRFPLGIALLLLKTRRSQV